MADEQVQERKRSPRGARLPQMPLNHVVPIAQAIRELAAPSTPQRIAQRLGVSPSSGPFRSRLGAAGYYGLIRSHGDRRELTELGERVLGSDDDGEHARREAVMSTGFSPILNALRGREANEGIVQARLQDDFGVPASASQQIARALIESAEQSQLIVSGRFDAGAIEDTLQTVSATAPEHGSSRQPRRVTQETVNRRSRSLPPQDVTKRDTNTHEDVDQTKRRLSPDVHLDIQIHIPADATSEQIDRIFASMAKHLYGRG